MIGHPLLAIRQRGGGTLQSRKRADTICMNGDFRFPFLASTGLHLAGYPLLLNPMKSLYNRIPLACASALFVMPRFPRPASVFGLLSWYHHRLDSIICQPEVCPTSEACVVGYRLAKNAETDGTNKANVDDPSMTEAGRAEINSLTLTRQNQ